ncbi:hypothetical protein JCM10908_000107, partial [Rhodotorula pacifica]|uniref:uncharacterized protein n=1 Tax=Rhodotorula pacifica TaxID=1495444 RepID=UPI00317D2157
MAVIRMLDHRFYPPIPSPTPLESFASREFPPFRHYPPRCRPHPLRNPNVGGRLTDLDKLHHDAIARRMRGGMQLALERGVDLDHVADVHDAKGKKRAKEADKERVRTIYIQIVTPGSRLSSVSLEIG